jgi:copper(I)-binding protein
VTRPFLIRTHRNQDEWFLFSQGGYMTRLKGVILALIVGVSLAACAGDNDKKAAGGIAVKDAWVRPTTAQMDSSSSGSMDNSGDVSGAFMVIENTSSRAERLVKASVSADVAESVEIHETTIDENSVMRMRPVEGIDVPANGSVELKPGGYHIMLLNVKKELKPGDKLPLTLTFTSGQTVTVEAEVRAMEG